MAALVDGRYAMAAIPDPALGPRHVDVATMYNTERYRPNYANKTGLPIFLTRADVLEKPEPKTPRLPLQEIVRHFNEAAADEENFPSTHRSADLSRPVDPRIFRRSERQARSGCRMRQGPVRARAGGALSAASIVGFDLAEAMLRHVPAGRRAPARDQ